MKLNLFKKIDRNYYYIIGFWFGWKILATFIAFLGIVFFNSHLRDHTFVENIYRLWNWWDGGFFNGIAATGYSEPGIGPHPILVRSAFFPLFPALIRLLGDLLKGNLMLAQYLIANLSYLTWVILLYYFLKNFIYPKKLKIALSACILAIVFPYSLFFMAGYSESLFMVFVIGFFIFLYKKQYYFAAACVALASITRFIGIGLLLILLIDIYLMNKRLILKIIQSVLCSIISVSLVVLYAFFLQIRFGKWNWFFLAEESWGRKFTADFLLKYFQQIKTNLIYTDHYSILFANDLFNLFLLLLALGVCIYCFLQYRKFLYFGIFILLMLAPAIFGGLLLSMARFTIVCFPVYFIIAELMENKSIPIALLASPAASIQAVLIIAFTSGNKFIG